MILAQLLPDPQSFQAVGWCVVILFSLVGGANQIMKLTDRFKPSHAQTSNIQPQPLVVAHAVENVALHAFEDHLEMNASAHKEIFSKIGGVERGAHARMEELRREMMAEIKDFHEKAEERSSKIHERINALAEEMPWKIIERLRKGGELKQ